MRDAQTGSEWLHYTGECVQGPMLGKTLRMLPMNILEWPAFKRRYPQATVIAHTPSLFRRLLGYFDGSRQAPSFFRLPGMFRRTMRTTSSTLPDMEFGLGVVSGQRRVQLGASEDGACFYRYRDLKAHPCVQDRIGELEVLVVWDDEANTGAAYEARVAGRATTFRLADGALSDAEGNRYDFAGRVTSGPDRGEKLRLLATIATRWYGFHQTYPDARVFDPAGVHLTRPPVST